MYPKIILILFAVYSSNCFALLSFVPGTYQLEGKIIVVGNETFFAVNPATRAETRFRITGKQLGEVTKQAGAGAVLKLKLKSAVRSSRADAELLDAVRFLDPFEVPKIYDSESSLKVNP